MWQEHGGGIKWGVVSEFLCDKGGLYGWWMSGDGRRGRQISLGVCSYFGLVSWGNMVAWADRWEYGEGRLSMVGVGDPVVSQRSGVAGEGGERGVSVGCLVSGQYVEGSSVGLEGRSQQTL